MATARDERRVLICDDEVRLGKLTAGLLTQSGYMAKTVSDGQQALRTLETDSGCGALLLDVNLPGLSARELLARMRASGLHQPVILTSGYPEEDVAPELMRDPMVKAYLGKPYTLDQLLAVVQGALDAACLPQSGSAS